MTFLSFCIQQWHSCGYVVRSERSGELSIYPQLSGSQTNAGYTLRQGRMYKNFGTAGHCFSPGLQTMGAQKMSSHICLQLTIKWILSSGIRRGIHLMKYDTVLTRPPDRRHCGAQRSNVATIHFIGKGEKHTSPCSPIRGHVHQRAASRRGLWICGQSRFF